MRQRRGDLEVADQAIPSDDDDESIEDEPCYSNVKSRKAKKRQMKKKRRKHPLSFHIVSFLRQCVNVLQSNIHGRAVVRGMIKTVNSLTALQWLALGVLVIFVQLPLVLFMFTEQKVHHENDIHYDIYHCPPKPVHDYPREYPVMQVLHHWPSANLSIPPQDLTHHLHKGICVFDLREADDEIQLIQTIQRYRSAQVPFVIRGDPDVQKTARFWTSEYLSQQLGATTEYPATLIETKGAHSDKDSFSLQIPMTWEAWDEIASSGSLAKMNGHNIPQYASLRLDPCLDDQPGDNNDECQSFLREDLSFLKQQKKKGDPLVLYDTSGEFRCNLVSPGFLRETRLDEDGGNYIVMLGGTKRYILAHPRNCQTLYFNKQKQNDDTSSYHRSEIHLKDHVKRTAAASSHGHHYNHPYDPAFTEHFPDFERTTVNEVVLEAGDVLYLPTHWVHHVITLSTSYHCNAASGHSKRYQHMVDKCLRKYGVDETEQQEDVMLEATSDSKD